ncbi:MAG: glycosyltransferase family 39 protein [Thermodesulfovibrionales bacterium]
MPIITKSGENRARDFSISWLFLIVIILFVIFVRIRLLEFPLERDEGEYAYMGQLILQGIPPYSEAYNMKFPGTYLMYALIMGLFGQTIAGIHIGFMIVNCATILLVYLVARKMMGDFPAAIAGGTYAVLSISSSVFGFAAHATHFVVLPAMAGTLLLLHAIEKEKLYLYVLSGILLGISVIMKQPGIFFCFFGATYILWYHFSSRPAGSLKALPLRLGAFSLGGSLPLIVTFLWLYAAGVFGRFWFWTIEYASKYGAQVPLSGAFSSFSQSLSSVSDGFFLFWILSALGLLATSVHKGLKVNRVFVLLFVLFSFLSICPGFYFRNHYFVTLLPAVALLSGIFIDFLSSKGFTIIKMPFPKFVGAGIFIAAAIVGVVQQKNYFFNDDPVKLSGSIYFGNPFPDSIEIARFIEARTTANDRIAVFGSEPQILFYAKRHSSTGYIYMYSLMEEHAYALTMQKEMIREVESLRPKFIVVVPISTSWLIRPDSEKYILGWIEDYLNKYFSLVGVADIVSPEITIYKWYDDARNYTVLSKSYVLIYERIR